MAEFPTLGRHCGVPLCNQLDFLPVNCDACRGTFCNVHFPYVAHSCDEGKSKDMQVPVCPLCSQPVPTRRDEQPDVAVNEHINNLCVVNKKKIFQNSCSLPGCKQKELVPVTCPSCHLNYCLRHRHERDHSCEKVGGRVMSNAAISALARDKRREKACAQQAKQSPEMLAADEALARRLAAESGGGGEMRQEELDRQLAEQLQIEENGRRRRNVPPVSQSSHSNCTLS